MKMSTMIITLEVLLSPYLTGMEEGDTLRTPLQAGYEHLLEFGSEEGSVSAMLEVLDGMKDTPLDLNLASGAELEQIPGLGPIIASRIVTRRTSRPFRNTEELAEIQGIAPDLLRAVAPFVTVKRRGAPIANRFLVRTRAARNGIGQSGTGQGLYPGSLEKLYTKFVARIEGLSASDQDEMNGLARASPSLTLGLVTEKDPGEKNYLDFVGGHLCASIPEISARIVLGDFVFEAGQGLVFWRASGFSKGSEATAGIARNGVGFRPSFSTDQAWTFRGAAAEVELRPAVVSAFYSNKPLDAGCDSDGVVTRFDVDGLHRTDHEIEERNRVREMACGARVRVDMLEGLQVGVSALATRFDKPVRLPGLGGFHGNGSSSFGVDVGLTLSGLRVFGEGAQD
ncbi:MAG: helix-hairpin-helix domain-containing protein, partial [Ignavibacteriales bacterium]|nr:helix-hairpin-helix domain-containing protein [Ignavibacteriales bacterium]